MLSAINAILQHIHLQYSIRFYPIIPIQQPKQKNPPQRNLHDAWSVARNILLEPKLLPGGGAAEMHLRMKMKQKKMAGAQQYAYQAVASAFEVIPRALANNAGADVVRYWEFFGINVLTFRTWNFIMRCKCSNPSLETETHFLLLSRPSSDHDMLPIYPKKPLQRHDRPPITTCWPRTFNDGYRWWNRKNRQREGPRMLGYFCHQGSGHQGGDRIGVIWMLIWRIILDLTHVPNSYHVKICHPVFTKKRKHQKSSQLQSPLLPPPRLPCSSVSTTSFQFPPSNPTGCHASPNRRHRFRSKDEEEGGGSDSANGGRK